MRLGTGALLVAVFLDLTGFGMMFPDIQLRAERMGARGWAIGAILAVYYLLQMLLSSHWGKWSDRWGRKPVLLACGALSGASMLVYAFGESVEAMALSRVLAGLGAANVVVAQAAVSDRTTGPARQVAQGRVSAAISLGLVLGPGLGGVLAHLGGSRLIGLVAASLSLTGTVWLLLGFRDDPPRTMPAPGSIRVDVSGATGRIWRDGRLRGVFGVAVVGWFALACLEGTFGRLIERTLGLGQLEFGLILALDGIAAALQGMLLPLLAGRLAPETLLRWSYLFQAVGLVALPFAPHIGVLIAFNILYGAGAGLAAPTINSVASERTTLGQQGEVFGLLQSMRALGFLVGPILGGALFDLCPELPYVAAAGAMAFAAFFAGRVGEKSAAPADPD